MFTYVQEHSEELHIHPKQIGVWVCSAGGPSSLTAVLRSTPDWLKCIVSYYALMDLHGLREHFGEKADLIEQFSATNHLKNISSPLPPMLVVRADMDRPVFNESIDRFVQEAKLLGHAITFINHPNGQHAFDILDDDETSRQIIKDTLVFMKDAVTSVD
ncbi:alpha/beta hydrolase [Brevibacillus sp. SYSU BS000544]|uniref:alpha/beta hydrolase n=1 Tax=Brevibacillus sp. SYSU BS000544 TaxID=3416443 RepID=UPI003CE5B451